VTARLSVAEAKALGLTSAAKGKKRTTRKTGRGPYHTRCRTCHVEFTTAASEDRHVHDTHHVRFELVVGGGGDTRATGHNDPPPPPTPSLPTGAPQ